MLNAADQTDWAKMYVYLGDAYTDLYSAVNEYLLECEHTEFTRAKEISSDTVDNVEAWRERRKELLLSDFAEYLLAR